MLNDLQQSISEGRMYLQRLSSPVGLYSVDATMARLTEFPSVTIDALGADSYETACHLSIEPIERLSGSRRDALVELAELLGPDDHVLLCCHNEGEHERLLELITETDTSHNTGLTSRIRLTTGRLSDRIGKEQQGGILAVGLYAYFTGSVESQGDGVVIDQRVFDAV